MQYLKKLLRSPLKRCHLEFEINRPNKYQANKNKTKASQQACKLPAKKQQQLTVRRDVISHFHNALSLRKHVGFRRAHSASALRQSQR